MTKLPEVLEMSLLFPLELPRAVAAAGFDKWFDSEVRSRYFRGTDFAGPEGDPGWFGPDSAVWHVHSHLPALTVGLSIAAYIEGLDPSIWWMAADHSRLVGSDQGAAPAGLDGYAINQEGAAVRLGHSLSFFLGTAYGSTETAERVTRTVRAMHHTVKGTRPDGLPYDADDPEWLRWNYATVVWGLATAHERYHWRPLRGRALDRYYGEFVRVGHALGGTELPETKAETLDCLRSYLPRLAVTPGRAYTTGRNLRRQDAPLPVFGKALDWAARDALPEWAARMVMHQRENPLVVARRRSAIWATVNGLHLATGPIKEFRQAQARVAGGTTVAHTSPAHVRGSDPYLSRDDVERELA